MIEVYSEKLDAVIAVPEETEDMEQQYSAETDSSSLVGWCHGGWDNTNGGGSW